MTSIGTSHISLSNSLYNNPFRSINDGFLDQKQLVEHLRILWLQDHFKSFETSFRFSSDPWTEGCLYDMLQTIINPFHMHVEEAKKYFENHVSKIFQLFLIATDSTLSSTEAYRIINKLLEQLNQDEHYGLRYTLVNKLPPIFATHILRFCEIKMKKNVIELAVHNQEEYAVYISSMIRECALSKWTAEDRFCFMNEVISIVSDGTRDQILGVLFEQGLQKTQTELYPVCSPKFQTMMSSFEARLEEQYSLLKKELQEKKVMPSLPKMGEHMLRCFINLCVDRLKDDEHFPALLLCFDIRVWEGLIDKFPKKEYKNKIFDWFVYYLEHLSNKVNLNKEYLFFQHFTKYLVQLPQERIRTVERKLKNEMLMRNFSGMDSEFLRDIFKEKLENHPNSFARLIHFSAKNQDVTKGDQFSDFILELVQKLKVLGYLPDALKLLLTHNKKSQRDLLTLYSNVGVKMREEIIRILMNSSTARENLIEWLKLLTDNIKPISSLVKTRSLENLVPCFIQASPEKVELLKSILKDFPEFCKDKEIEAIYPMLMAPTKLDLGKQAQGKAIEKLNQFLFTAPNYNQQLQFINDETWIKSLKQEDQSSVWLEKLFDALPHTSWPFLFLHFSKAINEAVNRKTKVNLVGNLSRWCHWVTTSLNHVIENPLLNNQVNDTIWAWTIDKIRMALEESGTYESVIGNYIRVAHLRTFLRVFDYLSHLGKNERDLAYLANQLNSLGKDKNSWIAKVIVGDYEKFPLRISTPSFSMNNKIFDPLFLNENELVKVVKYLQKKMGDKFFNYFIDIELEVEIRILSALKGYNSSRCKIQIVEWVKQVCGSKEMNDGKKALLVEHLLLAATESDIEIEEILSNPVLMVNRNSLINFAQLLIKDKLRFLVSSISIQMLYILKVEMLTEVLASVISERIKMTNKDNFFFICSLLECLNRLDTKYFEKLKEQLFINSNEVALKSHFRDHFYECFEDSYQNLILGMVIAWVPDWKERTIKLLQQKISFDEENQISLSSKSEYTNAKKILKALKKAKLNTHFFKFVKENESVKLYQILKLLEDKLDGC